MELGQSGKIEWNFTFLSLILANCPLFLLNLYMNSELIHIVTPSTIFKERGVDFFQLRLVEVDDVCVQIKA